MRDSPAISRGAWPRNLSPVGRAPQSDLGGRESQDGTTPAAGVAVKILTCPQRSPEWFQARAGRLGSSDAKDAFASKKSAGEPAATRDLRLRLAIEQLTGQPEETDHYVNADMQRGIDLEPAARAAYEAHTLTLVDQVGYVQHDELMAGASPDGFVDDEGLIEIKCPRPANHLRWMRAGTLPDEYLTQCRHGLWITGRQWIDFVSYCPALPAPIPSLWIVRLGPVDLGFYEAQVRQFLATVDAERDELLKMKG